jgi:plastocyanin domain-containing protein
MNQKIIIGILLFFSIGVLYLSFSSSDKENLKEIKNSNVSVQSENGIQVLKIIAYGGYNPRKISAKANVKTRLDVETRGTYDCSSSLVIPSLRYKKNLPPTAITSIDISPQESGSKITGLCSMGMFSFDISFE